MQHAPNAVINFKSKCTSMLGANADPVPADTCTMMPMKNTRRGDHLKYVICLFCSIYIQIKLEVIELELYCKIIIRLSCIFSSSFFFFLLLLLGIFTVCPTKPPYSRGSLSSDRSLSYYVNN
jgi:hypothetical protein